MERVNIIPPARPTAQPTDTSTLCFSRVRICGSECPYQTFCPHSANSHSWYWAEVALRGTEFSARYGFCSVWAEPGGGHRYLRGARFTPIVALLEEEEESGEGPACSGSFGRSVVPARWGSMPRPERPTGLEALWYGSPARWVGKPTTSCRLYAVFEEGSARYSSGNSPLARQ
jgi:hypothetical protein